jgi:hypothetical protein
MRGYRNDLTAIVMPVRVQPNWISFCARYVVEIGYQIDYLAAF